MRVYFYVRNDEGCLQEDVITLAEGLRELGIPFYANCNYWQETTEPGRIPPQRTDLRGRLGVLVDVS